MGLRNVVENDVVRKLCILLFDLTIKNLFFCDTIELKVKFRAFIQKTLS